MQKFRDVIALIATIRFISRRKLYYSKAMRHHLKTLTAALAASLVFAGNLFAAVTEAASTVQYDATTRIFGLDGEDVTYAFGINERGEVQSVYWGGHLAAHDTLPTARAKAPVASFDSSNATTAQECAGWGGGLYAEPALKITFPDGNRDSILKYFAHHADDAGLHVVLKDISRDVFVELLYVIDPLTGVLARSAVIQNKTREPLTIEQAAAANVNLAANDHYRLSDLTGRWASEFNLQQREIVPGKTVLESRRGSTGHENSPWFAIDRGSANEEYGDVWFGALAWSGSWRVVIDDGWFGQRNDDHAGLGDWYANPRTSLDGLSPLIKVVNSLGMDFGLWVEPEMINVDSDLYRKHPDWILNFAGRPRNEQRNPLVLNLARPEVRDYVFAFLDQLLTENRIAFLKWDYNRNWREPGWPEKSVDAQRKLYVTYVENLHSILSELWAKHPTLEIESCSGGGRVDLGILQLTDQVWTSDNTNPFDRLLIQDGPTHAYLPGVMVDWVTDFSGYASARTFSLEYRFLSAMQGALGIGANLEKWTPKDFSTAKELTNSYKQIRETVQHGLLYRLLCRSTAANIRPPNRCRATRLKRCYSHSYIQVRGSTPIRPCA